MIISEATKNKTFKSKKAGSFSGVPQRTVQAWTERKLLDVPSGGTGDQREYSLLDCIEIGIIKSLTAERLALNTIKLIMDALHFPYQKHGKGDVRGKFLLSEEACIVVRFGTGKIEGVSLIDNFESVPKPHQNGFDSFREYWQWATLPTEDTEKVLVVNVAKIARGVLSKIDTGKPV